MKLNKIYYITLKELKSFFISPIAYIVISIFLLVIGWFFFSTFFINKQADMRNFFALMPLVFSFIIPAITMRMFSEEFNVGSYEILSTLPLSTLEIILGKFFATLSFVVLMLLPTLFYPIFIMMIGTPDLGPIVGGYIGTVFLAAAFCGVGILTSSLSRNQIVAFILGMVVCFFFALIDKMLFFIPVNMIKIFQYLGADYHFQNIAKGLVDSRDLIYFISIAIVGLLMTKQVIEAKK